MSLDDVLRALQEVTEEQIVQRYKDGDTITQIARDAGCSRERIYRKLRAAGVYTSPRKSGPPRKEECKRRHNLAEWGVEIPKARGGGRSCRMCKRERERVH